MKQNIAFIFAGDANHKQHPNCNYFTSFNNTFIQPLIHHFNIHIFIGCGKNQINGWENKLKNKLDPSINCVIFNELVENDILRSRSRFSGDICTNNKKMNFKIQYGKLHFTWNLVKKYIEDNNIIIDYVFKMRYDFIYKDDNTFLYEWIKYLNDNIIATSSTEFHVNDRWSDRTEKDDAYWPKMVSDQIIFGNFMSMNIYFNLFPCQTIFKSGFFRRKFGMEHILANYLQLNKIQVYAFDLQFSRPGNNWVLGRNNKWLEERDNKVKFLEYNYDK